MTFCRVRDLGRISYPDGVQLQKELVEQRQDGKIADTLLLVEHPPIYTIGKVGSEENLLIDKDKLREIGAEVFPTDRGGDITYHGPGQIVGYPILDLHDLKQDVKWYLEQLEEVMIRSVGHFGVSAGRNEGFTGAWIDERKIGAIGVRVSKWVTSHGFALNVRPDLRYFQQIVPCGIPGKDVTSLAAELGRDVSVEEVRPHVVENFGAVFQREMVHEQDAPQTPQEK